MQKKRKKKTQEEDGDVTATQSLIRGICQRTEGESDDI